jgi:hypothetical protein
MAPRKNDFKGNAVGTQAKKCSSAKAPPTIFLEAIPSPILKVGARFPDPTQYWVVDASGKRLYLLEKRVSSLKRTHNVVFVPPQAPEEQPLDLTLFNGAFVFLPFGEPTFAEPTFAELFDETLGSEITNIPGVNLNLDSDSDFDFSGMEIPDLSIPGLEEFFSTGFSLEELEEIMTSPLKL